MRFDVLLAVTTKTAVFQDVNVRSLVKGFWRNQLPPSSLLYHESGGSRSSETPVTLLTKLDLVTTEKIVIFIIKIEI